MLKLLKNVTSPSQRRTEPEPLMMSVGLGDGSAVPAVARASAAAGAARSREGSTSSHRLDATLAEERRRAMADKDALITLLQQQVQMTSGGAMGFGPGASPTRAAMASPKSASSSAASPRGNSGVTHVPGAALAASAGMATAPGTMQQTPAEEALKRELRLTRMQLAATKEQNLAIGKQLRASQRQMRKATAQSLMISGHASGPGGGDNSGGSGSFKRRTRTPLSHASPHTRTRGLSGSGSRTSFLHRTRSGRGSAMSDKGSCAGSEKGSAKDLDESIGATAVDADDEDELAPLGGMNSKLTSGRLATLDEASGVELLLSKKDKRMFERLIGSSDDDRGTEPGRCRTKRSDTATSLDPEALRNASIPVSLLKKELQLMGLAQTDPRLAAMYEELVDVDTLDFEQFQALKSQFMLVDDALSGELAISNFGAFCDALVDIYHNTTDRRDGDVARYIPALARVEPEQYGVAVCSIHGQRFGVGDVKVPFCVQSSSKPLTYCMATELLGEEKVHRHIGREPSGRNFNDRVLKQPEGVPHNPYINAGAIMAASLVKMEEDEDARFDYVTSVWAKASGGARVGFQNSTFMGERATASRNFCLGWMMLEEGAFDDKLVHSQVTLTKVLESYFMYCSLEIDCEAMAVVASTLANAGACPLTDERVFQPATVKSCLSLMLSCGMYDYSGEFAFTVGLPTKSGVSGVLCIVVPGLCGISTFSPRLDKLGNSVRGIAFCKEFATRFPVHIFDSTLQRAHASLIDDVSRVEGHVAGSARRKSQVGPNAQGGDGGASLILRGSHIGQRRERELDLVQEQLSALWFACASGDIFRVRQLVARGLDLNISDYDKRSALHLASAEGHMEIVLYLLANGAHVFARDRFGCQPVDDARRGGHTEIEDHLRAVENTPVRSSLKRVGSFLGTQPDGAVAGAGKKDKAASLSRGVSFAGMDVKVAAALNRSRADPEAGSDGESRGDDDESSYRSMEFASQSMETLWDSEEILPELIVRFLDIDGKGRECGVTRAELVRALEMLCGFWLGVERGQDDKMSGSASRRHELWQTVSALPESGITATALRDLLRTEKYGAKIRRIGAALRGQLVIPNFPAFYEQIGGIYEEAASLHLKVVKRSALVGNAGGHGSGGTGESEGGDEETEEHDRHDTANLTMKLVLEDGPTFAEGTDAVEAGLIQTQASVRRYRDPQSALNGFALCTISGQRLALGASQHRFCTDQLCRPFAYAWAQEKLGNEAVRQVVGQEPSGSSAEFDPLNQDGKPYNPMTTAGFMALCAILETHSAPEQRLRTALQLWRDMSGTSQPRLSMSGYEAMRGPDQLDTQTSLLYMLRKMRVVPHDTNMEDTLEFCAMLHAIEVNAESISVLAATLANGGVCPLTNRRVLQPSTVRNTLSLMHSCGMGDESGAFAFDVGIPAKYARTGAVMLVVPGVLGACYFAPGVNCHHIPVRAKYFFSKFAQLYNFHPYDSLIGGTKIDPRLYDGNEVSQQINKLLGAAQGGDLTEIKHLNFQGVDLNSCDYDRRTAAHLAASEGHLHVLTYFAQQGVDMSVTDRWGSMPIDDARNGEWEDVVEALENWLNPPSAAVGGESEV